MRVHYKDRIIDQIRDAITKASDRCREVDFIELTDREFHQFRRELSFRGGPTAPRFIAPFQVEITFMGVEIVKESPVQDDEEELF